MLLASIGSAAATGAPHFSDSVTNSSVMNWNCVSTIFPPAYLESEVGFFVGQYVDDESTPKSPVVGEVFDVRLVVATLGNSCGGTAPQIEIALPPGVRPAVGGDFTIRCFTSVNLGDPNAWQAVPSSAGCPTTLDPGFTNHPNVSSWYGLNPNPATYGGDPLWKIGQGSAVQIQVPVVADRLMYGIGDTSGCSCVIASVKTINGHAMPDLAFSWASSSPNGTAYQPLFVFPGKLSSDDPQPDGPGASVALKRLGKAKVRGASVKFGATARFRVPDGMSATKACSGKVKATVKQRGKRRGKSSAKLTSKGKYCEAKLKFKAPKSLKGKKVDVELSFAGNSLLVPFNRTLKYRIR
jgi:hypothetical protein